MIAEPVDPHRVANEPRPGNPALTTTAVQELHVPVMGYGRCMRCSCSSFMGGWGRRYCAGLTCHHEFDDHR
jgi:hypothetical protein